MVRPSNPVLMSAVLNAVARLSEGKGSTVRDILNFVRQNSNGFSRNLTMQVHRALKHAVNAGLLRHQGGRYKVLISVNPISAQPSPPEDSKSGDDIPDKVPNGLSKRRIKDTGKQPNGKRQPRKKTRSKSGQRKYARHRKHGEAAKETKVVRRPKGKASGKVEECDERISAPVRRKRLPKRKPSEIQQKELSPSSDRSRDHICDSGSDITEDSTCGRSTNPKSKLHSRDGGRLLSPTRKRSLIRQEAKGQNSKARSRKRSTSRNRSPQRQNYNQNQHQQQQQLQLQLQQHHHQHQQQQQLEIQEIPSDNLDDVRMDCEQVVRNVECSDEATNQDTERTCKANNSGSGSSL